MELVFEAKKGAADLPPPTREVDTQSNLVKAGIQAG